VALIVLGVAATFCLAGSMRCVDLIVHAPARPRWFWRWPLYALQRIILVAQLATTGIAIVCGGLLFTHRDLPAPQAGMYFAPNPPPEAQPENH
jgi:hypothetical protein